ncbi:MAG: lipoprotein-releasing ABC transporter permease subunit [Rickettsiaceae bacterium]|nr:lipoprotein-releasing ABC transporter permease subunit [Rickettsiaceae bacterium]
MLSKFALIISSRYFRAKKNEKFVSIISGISLIGITIGVAALIIVMSVMNGFHIEFTKNIIGLNGDIIISPYGKIIKNSKELEQKLNNYDFVKNKTTIAVGQALALGRRANSGVLIKGIDITGLKHKEQILDNVIDGSFSNYVDNDVVAIGSGVAKNLGLTVGSTIKMIAPNLISTMFGSMPRTKEFTIVAVFQSGMYDYDAATVLMPLKAAQKFLSLDDGINLIELNIDNSDLATIQAKVLHQDLVENHAVKIASWMQYHGQFLKALEVERTAMFTILSLIILVAAFNIISSLFMLVKDKTKDIAILRTIGASTRQIMAIFMINGMIIGIIGTSLGVALGLIIAKNIENIRIFLQNISGTAIFDPAIYFLYNLPSVVQIEDAITITALSIILCFLATIYPAYRAAKLNPVEAMRYE